MLCGQVELWEFLLQLLRALWLPTMVDPHCPRCQNVKNIVSNTQCTDRLIIDLFYSHEQQPGHPLWSVQQENLTPLWCNCQVGANAWGVYTTFMTIESKLDMDRTWWCLSRREERRGRPAPNILENWREQNCISKSLRMLLHFPEIIMFIEQHEIIG